MKIETINGSIFLKRYLLYKIIYEYNKKVIKIDTEKLNDLIIKRDFKFLNNKKDFDLVKYMFTCNTIECGKNKQSGNAFVLNTLIHSNDYILKIIALLYSCEEKTFFIEKERVEWFADSFIAIIDNYQKIFFDNKNDELEFYKDFNEIKEFLNRAKKDKNDIIIFSENGSPFNNYEISLQDFFELDNWKEIIEDLKNKNNDDFYSLDWEDLPKYLAGKINTKEQMLMNIIDDSKSNNIFDDYQVLTNEKIDMFYFESNLNINDYLKTY